MNRKSAVAMLGLAATMAGLSGCDLLTAKNYRVTATINVNGTPYTGSSVQQFRCSAGGGLFGSMDVAQCHVKGEAVVIDLKDRGSLFVIFEGPHGDMTSMVTSLIGAGGMDPFQPSNWTRKDAWDIPIKDMPRMVTFRNVADPKTAEEVDSSDLGRTFGEGVSLASLHVEPTDAPITRGIVDKTLPWLRGLGDNTLSGTFGTMGNSTSDRLYGFDFEFEE